MGKRQSGRNKGQFELGLPRPKKNSRTMKTAQIVEFPECGKDQSATHSKATNRLLKKAAKLNW